MYSAKKIIFSVVAVLVLLGLALSLPHFLSDKDHEDPSAQATAAGVSYIKSMEAKDPTEVEARLKEERRQELIAKQDEFLAQLQSGELSVWTLFEDYLFLGDSRVVGFVHFGFLSDDRVWADSGDSIYNLGYQIDEIVAANPSNLFVSYGLNELHSGMWLDAEEYATDYEEYLLEIQEKLPDTNIFVNSILPAYEPALSETPRLYWIPEFNAALEAMCQRSGFVYIDNDTISATNAACFVGDGIHMFREFYPIWAENMMTACLKQGFDKEIQAID